MCSDAFIAELADADCEAEELAPHVFRTARLAYDAMRSSRVPQSILVGGESGAGKTETVKLALGAVARLSGSSGSGEHATLYCVRLSSTHVRTRPAALRPCVAV